MNNPVMRAMPVRPDLLTGLSLAVLALAGGCTPRVVSPVERAASRPAPAAAPDPGVATTIVGGESPVPAAPAAGGGLRPGKAGTIEFSIPAADVRTLARVVLGDTLKIPYTVVVTGDVEVGLSTPGPVNRSQLLELFEAALRKADLAMVWQGTGYKITTVAAAKAESSGLLPDRGFATETVTLQFANAAELKKLLDTVVPGAVQQVDETRNTLVIAGTEAQRKGVHDVIAQFDVNWLRSMSFALYVPQRTDARLIVPELEKLINAADAPTRGLVRLIAMDKLNGVIAITQQKQYLEDVRRWVEILDREGAGAEPRLFVYRVQNGRARDLVKTLNATFGFGGGDGGGDATDPAGNGANGANGGNADGAARPARPATPPGGLGPAAAADRQGGGGGAGSLRVRISADEINNAVVVYGPGHDYAIVEDALRRLDVQPMQVMIEAAITEVGLTDDMSYGVQWNWITGNANFGYSEGSGPAPTRAFPGFSLAYSNRDTIRATLNALEQHTQVKVVSAPKLLVLNNQTAALQVGDQVPVTTQTLSNAVGTGSTAVANSVEYRDTGVILKITPRVNASGAVLLDVSQEVSDVSTTKTSSINSPTISTRKIATTVSVQDGQVIALGGLFRNSATLDKNGIPLLSRLPVVGALFGSHDNVVRKTELIVLIKPHVLRTPDDLSAITEELRDKISTLEPFKTKGRIP